MKNWRDYLQVTSVDAEAPQNQNPLRPYAKYAKKHSPPSDSEVLHILHMDPEHSETEFSASDPTEPPPPLELVLKGRVVELWSDLLGECLWLVADEEDARRLGEPRGFAYTATKARLVCRMEDKAVVREVQAWKRSFNGVAKKHRRGAQP